VKITVIFQSFQRQRLVIFFFFFRFIGT